MDDERELILQVFETQCEDGLGRMEEALLALEARPDDDEALNTVFRICHTVKGDSDILGFTKIAELAHVLEDILDSVRGGDLTPGEALISLLLEARDALDQLVRHFTEGGDAEHAPRFDDLMQGLRAQATDLTEREVVDDPPHTEESIPSAGGEALDTASAAFVARTIRVRIDTLDRLVDLTGELAIGRSRITQLLNADVECDVLDLREAHHAVDRLFSELQEEVMKIRMVPVGPVFRQHLRTVRDVALSQGKRARLEIEGGDVELDMTVIEHLRDCLGHMVRNSISHGIETPEERDAAGKSTYGTVRLSASHEGSNIVVQIEDDGSGLHFDDIRRHSIEIGLVSETDQLSDAQVAELIFKPGFSTATDTTRVSGRGVGMDVVKRRIEALGGSVNVTSVTGEGTIITLCLPLTLAIVEGFAVGLGSEVYVMPLSSVVECIDLSLDDQGYRMGGGVINLRGEPLPYVHLREVLGYSHGISDRQTVVVVRHNGAQAGLAVDSLLGENQAVIKPLGSMFRDLPGVAGATILGDGQVALILDVPALLRTAVERATQMEIPFSPIHENPQSVTASADAI